jgi:hypothetical protein
VRLTIILAAICMAAVSSTVVQAEGAAQIARRAAACYSRSAAVLDKQSKESGKAGEDLNKIGDTNHAGLCEYGRKIGTPLLERHIVEQKALKNSGCWDRISESVLAASEKILANYKKNVEDDCKKAEQAPSKPQSPAISEDGPCGAVVAKIYEDGGIKGGNVHERTKNECIKVGNKCTYRITFVVLRSGLRVPLSESVEPGGTGKICVDNESQTLQFVRWKKWGTIGR